MFRETTLTATAGTFLEFTSCLVEQARPQLMGGPALEASTTTPDDNGPNDEGIYWASLRWFEGLDSYVATETGSVRFGVLSGSAAAPRCRSITCAGTRRVCASWTAASSSIDVLASQRGGHHGVPVG